MPRAKQAKKQERDMTTREAVERLFPKKVLKEVRERADEASKKRQKTKQS
jgi:hypothetical protein